MDEVLSRDIPELMKLLPQEDAARFREHQQAMEVNPFAQDPDRTELHSGWAVTTAMKARFDNEFFSLELGADDKASGGACKKVFMKSRLDQAKLRTIWDLADIDRYTHTHAHTHTEGRGGWRGGTRQHPPTPHQLRVRPPPRDRIAFVCAASLPSDSCG